MGDGVPLTALPILFQILSQDDPPHPNRDDTLQILCEMVGSSYGAIGAELGESVRRADGVGVLVRLLRNRSPSILQQALFLLANLASDAVDSQSHLTKALMLESGAEKALLPLVISVDDEVCMYASAALQNLCHDLEWAKRMVDAGVEARLEHLLKHADPRVVRYASGALKNLTLASPSAGGRAPQLSADASNAVRQRELEAAREAFMHKRARRAIDGGALREHRTRSFLDPGEGDDDPFDGLSPEEIAKLAEGEGKRETEGGA